MGKKIGISIDKQGKLRKKVQKEINRLESIYDQIELKDMIDNFKDRFMICEASYKTVLSDYLYIKNGRRDDRLKISMKQVPSVMEFAGYEVDKDLLAKIFGSEEKVGVRSVKKLRDALTHKAQINAIKELKERNIELNGYMDSFLKIINEEQLQ